MGKCYYFLSFSIFFAGLGAVLKTVKWTSMSSQMAKSRTLICLVLRVTGQLSRNTLATAHAHNDTWPTSEKKRYAFAVPRGPLAILSALQY